MSIINIEFKGNNMRKIILAALTAVSFASVAETGVKVGIARDMDLSIVAQYNQFNFVLGDKGIAVDYIIKRGTFNPETPLTWYVGGGAYAGFNHGLGVRAPLGVEWAFAKGWDAYIQAHPTLDFDDDVDFGIDGALGVRYAF